MQLEDSNPIPMPVPHWYLEHENFLAPLYLVEEIVGPKIIWSDHLQAWFSGAEGIRRLQEGESLVYA